MQEARLKALTEASSTTFRRGFSLHGRPLLAGDWLELCIFGHWVPGRVEVDAGGWFLLTLDHVGIRLSDGLAARLVVDPPASTAAS